MSDEIEVLAARIAHDIFKVGDSHTPCQRIQFMGGVYPDNEIGNGGFDQNALKRCIKESLSKHYKPESATAHK